jgi:hypothetical protein
MMDPTCAGVWMLLEEKKIPCASHICLICNDLQRIHSAHVHTSHTRLAAPPAFHTFLLNHHRLIVDAALSPQFVPAASFFLHLLTATYLSGQGVSYSLGK